MPFDGRVADVSPDLSPGNWVQAGEKLMQVVAPQGSKVEAFLDEAQAQNVVNGTEGTFVPGNAERARVACKGSHVDAVQLNHLDQASAASVYGGPVPAQRHADGRLVPLQPTFRLRLEACDLAQAPTSEVVGIAVLHGERRSLIGRAWRHLVAVLQREAAL